jgi:molybdenum cofactor synthesis domain
MERDLISIEEARKLISEHAKPIGETFQDVIQSLGCVISEDIFSPIDIPSFTNSAMDGYAINTETIKFFPARLKVIGEIRAGDSKKIKLKEGQAIKIFTGAPVPDGADAVVEKELVKVDGDYIIVDKEIKKGRNIRLKGEEIKKGEKVIDKGTIITPAVAGFLSALGIKRVKVFRKPKVSVIITGGEIIRPGRKLKYGKVYDSNSVSLQLALKENRIEDIRLKFSEDNLAKLRKIFREEIRKSDILIFSGGISAGDYDYVRDLMEEEKVEKIFYKVKQKPGKPLFFGKKGNKFIFALPGNPAAVLVCFYEYVLPFIKGCMNYPSIFPKEEEKKLFEDVENKSDRLNFMRGKIIGEEVKIFEHQDSYMLSSFAKCDCLVLIPPSKKITKGEKVKVHILWEN